MGSARCLCHLGLSLMQSSALRLRYCALMLNVYLSRPRYETTCAILFGRLWGSAIIISSTRAGRPVANTVTRNSTECTCFRALSQHGLQPVSTVFHPKASEHTRTRCSQFLSAYSGWNLALVDPGQACFELFLIGISPGDNASPRKRMLPQSSSSYVSRS